MASGLFMLLDDIATLMDDVVVMSKIATKKTAGILGDDLAVNAEKSSGFVSSRELPVLWVIGKGSFLNKLIILPFAFLLSAFLPWMITLILSLGALYLAYEGAEKIHEYFFHKQDKKSEPITIELSPEEILSQEKEKIKSAIVTDFILSIEIVIIALGTVLEQPIVSQIMVVSIVSIIATVGVYGIVALIVRMDDFGYKLTSRKNSVIQTIGRFFINALPKVVKSLAFIGTVALLLVSGGILSHNIAFIHHLTENIPTIFSDFVVGLLAGIICLLVVSIIQLIIKKLKDK